MFGAQDEFGAIKQNLLSGGAVFEGRFQIISVLGEGGVGIVYKAQHLHMGKLVAIKTLMPSMVSDDNSFVRFEQEARAASNLNHANIITIHDFGRSADGTAYLVMEYLDGKTLSNLLDEKGTLDLDAFLRIFGQICEGLQHAHKKGVIHRDMKPSNVMLIDSDESTNVVKIVDFGLAKIASSADSQQHLTQTGAVVGTPLFMSPEQCKGAQLDQRSDIYSVGCMMYAALCGKVPHKGENALNTMVKHMVEEPLPFALSIPEIVLPPSLEAVILKSLHKDPADRQQSMSELKTDITNAIYFRQAPAATIAGNLSKNTSPSGSNTDQLQTTVHDAARAQISPQSASVSPLTQPSTFTSPQRAVRATDAGMSKRSPNIGLIATLILVGVAGIGFLGMTALNSKQSHPTQKVSMIDTAPNSAENHGESANNPPKPALQPEVKEESAEQTQKASAGNSKPKPTNSTNSTDATTSTNSNNSTKPGKPTHSISPSPKIALVHRAEPQFNYGAAIKSSLESANEYFREGNLSAAITNFEKCRAYQIAADRHIGPPVFVTDAKIVECWLESGALNKTQPFLTEAQKVYDSQEAAVKIVAARSPGQSNTIWFPLARACFLQARAAGESGNSLYMGWAAIFGLNAVESWSGTPDSQVFAEMKATCAAALNQVNPQKAALFRRKYNMPEPQVARPPIVRRIHKYPKGAHIREY